MRPVYTIEPLGKIHDRAAFACGVEQLDHYIKLIASQDMRRRLAITYVMHRPESPTVIGYYTLSAYAIQTTELPDDLRRRVKYEHVPAAMLGRLALDRNYHGQRLGALLLVDALKRAVQTEVAVMAVVVDAIDDRARQFYEMYGFERLADHPNRLFITAKTIEQLIAG